MADVASKLRVSELDFGAIKSNLKNFLGDQNEFADWVKEAGFTNVVCRELTFGIVSLHYGCKGSDA